MLIDFDLEEIMRCWADEHPAEMAYISALMYIYDQERAIYRIRMECIDRHGQRHRIVEKLDRSDLGGKSDPFTYVLDIISEMYKELQKNVYKEKEKKEMPPKFTFAEEIKSVTFTPIDNDHMLKMAKAAVVAWYNEHNAPATIGMEDVYITWFCKVLQNWKALAGTHHSDGMYYEVTYDGDKDAAYVDAYKKWQNVSMSGEDIRDNVRRW